MKQTWERVEPEWRAAMDRYALQRGLELLWELLAAINSYIVTREPWALAKREGADSPALARVLHNALEGLRLVAVALSPVMPEATARMLRRLGCPAGELFEADLGWGGLPLNVALGAPETLFPRVDTREWLAALAAAPSIPRSKETVMNEEAPAPPAPPAASGDPVAAAPAAPPVSSPSLLAIDEFMKIDLRVAEILAAEAVPKSKKLLKLRVSLGTEERTVVAGIATRYRPEELVGRKVVVVANLAPAKLMGVESQGMVLAASIDGEASLLAVDAAVPAGTKVK